jgi:TolB-like protein
MSDRAIFLSYASQDAAAAQRICDALRAAGLEVWFDQNELRGGDAWDQRIRRQIKTCRLFVPVISAHTQARREGYFRLEWHLAEERSRLFAKGTPFLVPIVVDATPDRDALVPEAFFAVQWTRLPGAEVPPTFVERIQELMAGEIGVPPPNLPTAPGATESAPPFSRTPAPTRSRRRGPALVAAAVVVLAAAGAFFALRPRGGSTAADTPRALAVLPFASLNDDRRNQVFIDGIHEDILTDLANLANLTVIARTSVLQYRETAKPATQIATELGVSYLVEGSVQREVGKLHVTARLVNARTGELLWAKRYTRDLTDLVMTLQAELAGEIATALKTALAGKNKA